MLAAHNTHKNGLYGKEQAEQWVNTCMARGLVHVGSRCSYRCGQFRDMVDQWVTLDLHWCVIIKEECTSA